MTSHTSSVALHIIFCKLQHYIKQHNYYTKRCPSATHFNVRIKVTLPKEAQKGNNSAVKLQLVVLMQSAIQYAVTRDPPAYHSICLQSTSYFVQ
jgi:hypothetical protein